MHPDNPKIFIPRLLPDGTNWVIYHDRFLWVMENNLLDVHLQNENTPSEYADAGTINSLDAAT